MGRSCRATLALAEARTLGEQTLAALRSRDPSGRVSFTPVGDPTRPAGSSAELGDTAEYESSIASNRSSPGIHHQKRSVFHPERPM
jgi:hypothetical protein